MKWGLCTERVFVKIISSVYSEVSGNWPAFGRPPAGRPNPLTPSGISAIEKQGGGLVTSCALTPVAS